MTPLVELKSLTKQFSSRRGSLGQRHTVTVHAVDDVTLEILEGETLGIVGESGCGKSTLGRCVVRLIAPTSGEIRFAGTRIDQLSSGELRPLRKKMQIVFQDPYASLNPRRRVADIIADPLDIHGIGDRAERRRQVADLLETVGLAAGAGARMPREFSGGQRQRIAIARALALRPSFLVADEPVSALDVSVQAQIVNLLLDLQEQYGLTYLFIAHDLGVVRQMADRVVVMYLGRIVEVAPAEDLHLSPVHPYTEMLLSAVPVPDPDAARARSRIMPRGEPPSPLNPPSGCRFHPRCQYATDVCQVVDPPLVEMTVGRLAACHHPLRFDSGNAPSVIEREALSDGSA
jgi:oligopeptide/dipeptide ABC transporter ATP-binding protein